MSATLATLFIFAASQVGTPGPANMALLVTGAAHGFRATLPFMLGVICGKQLLAWPMGFGLMKLALSVPLLFSVLKYASAAYIIWLAWRVANLRLKPGEVGSVPGFLSGLVVHPLNPKAWAMLTAGFTNFISPDTPALQGTATIAAVFFLMQLVFHPLWTFGGERIAAVVAGTPVERYLMWMLAGLTVASVFMVLFNS